MVVGGGGVEPDLSFILQCDELFLNLINFIVAYFMSLCKKPRTVELNLYFLLLTTYNVYQDNLTQIYIKKVYEHHAWT